MSYYYSKTTLGFYSNDIHATMPDDVVEVSDSDYTALFEGQAEGKLISANDAGSPELIDRPAATTAQKWAAYQTAAQGTLSDSDTSMLRIYEAVILGDTTMEAPDVVAFVKWRQELRAILSTAQPEEIPDALPAMPAYPVGTGTPSTNSSTTTTDTTTEAQS